MFPLFHRLGFASLLCLVSWIAGCNATGGAESTTPAAVEPAWDITGWRVIACCCPTPCPCRLDKKPTNCHGCDHTDVVHVDRGQMGGVKMDGVTWTVVGRGFGEDLAGNWVYVYVDERASEEQVAALGAWLAGGVKAWGPKAAFLAGKFVGMREVPMRVEVAKDSSTYTIAIPEILDLRTRAIVNPGHEKPVVSTGILDAFGDTFVHADALAHTYKDATIGYEWDLTGRQANQAAFSVDSERAAAGGIGWGCWTAHADFGDSAPYGEELVGHDGEKSSCH